MHSRNIPTTLHHYYEHGRAPFLSISETSPAKFRDLMSDIGESNILDNRFDTSEKREFYQFFRLYTEDKLRSEFIRKGGQPTLTYPRYLTLGPTTWFFDWYEDAQEIVIPLDEIDSKHISFTYPDSMMSWLIAEDRYPPFAQYKQNYHGELFLRSELPEVIDQYGLPDETDSQNLLWGNRIVEAQIWDMTVLQEYLS